MIGLNLLQVSFWVLAPIMVIAALGLVFAKKAVHAALSLAVVMICLAMMYAVQQAPFLFVVQIIVYTGAILMLFLFVIMLVGVDTTESLVETIKGQRVWAAIAGFGILALLVLGVGSVAWAPAAGLTGTAAGPGPNDVPGGNPVGLAQLLFSKYVIAFEATSALLITAALGAMLLAFRDRTRPKLTQREASERRMQRYAEEGVHPGPLPTPGVLARHNAVDTPALLPDGSMAPNSTAGSMQARGTIVDEVTEQRETRQVAEVEQAAGAATARADSNAELQAQVDAGEPPTAENTPVPRAADDGEAPR